jgi:hypothetical protein
MARLRSLKQSNGDTIIAARTGMKTALFIEWYGGKMKTALLIVPVIAVLLAANPSAYAGIIHRTVLPPGASSTSDTVKILPNGTAVTVIPAHTNYTQMLTVNQTVTINPSQIPWNVAFHIPSNIINVELFGSIDVVGGGQIRFQLYDTTNCHFPYKVQEIAQCGQKYMDQEVSGAGHIALTPGRHYVSLLTNDIGGPKQITMNLGYTFTYVNGTK